MSQKNPHKHTYDEHDLCFECDKPKPKSPKERKADERARKREAGLVRYEEWVTPEERQALKLRLEYMRRKNKVT